MFKTLKNNAYLIIPIACFFTWALLLLIEVEVFLYSDPDLFHDFEYYYYAGNFVFHGDPQYLYTGELAFFYFYMPSTALFFGVFFSWYPLHYAIYVMFSFLLICGFLMIVEYDKILRLMGLNKKSHRLLFIIVAYNGRFIYEEFWGLNIRILTGLILLFLLRREMDFNIEKNFKYYVINYGLFIFMLGFAPYLVFLFLVYIFYNIKLKKLIARQNIMKYIIIIFMFVVQNFLFIIYPSLILDFINKGVEYRKLFIYCYGWLYARWFIFYLPAEALTYFFYASTFTILSVSIYLIFNKKLKINERFSLFFLTYLLVGAFSFQSMLTFQLILLLYIPYLMKDYRGIRFIERNYLLLIGLGCILTINLLRKLFDMVTWFNLNKNIIFVGSSIICLINLKLLSRDFKIDASLKEIESSILNT